MTHFIWFVVWPFFWVTLGMGCILHSWRTSGSWGAWAWFGWVQWVMLWATVLGWFLLIPFCLTHAWTKGGLWPSINPTHRAIDRWRWQMLNKVYGNPEDGVSGQTASAARRR